MTIQELEYYLSHSSNYPLHSFQFSDHLTTKNLEVCEHALPDGKIVELTLDRKRGKMILEVYRGGDMVGEPLNFFIKPVTDVLFGEDWLLLEPVDIIQRVLNREESLKTA